MLFTNIRGLKAKVSEFIRKTGKGEEVIITNKGKPVALLRNFSEDEIEEHILNHPKFLKQLDKLSAECEKKGGNFRDLLKKKGFKIE